MKKIFLAVILLFSLPGVGQYKKVEIYIYNGEEIKYSRIDYSQYGIGHVFVTMYEESEKNKLIEKNATTLLRNEKNLYHTLYFFIEIPVKYNFEEKEIIFNEIMKEILKKEKLKNSNLFFNFDIDYSEKYQKEMLENKLGFNVKRIFVDINSENIKNGLSIKWNYIIR